MISLILDETREDRLRDFLRDNGFDLNIGVIIEYLTGVRSRDGDRLCCRYQNILGNRLGIG